MNHTRSLSPAWKTVLYGLAVALLMALLGWLLFARLGEWPIESYDEARHGVSAYEMLRSGDYLVTTYQGEPDYWNLKPPLSFWSIAAGYRLFGCNAFALRFYSALAIWLAAAALALWSHRRLGRWPTLLLLLLLAGNLRLLLHHFARFGDADAQYQLFFTLAMLCMLKSEKDFRWFYGCGLCFGLAFLDKGAHALTIPAVCFLDLLCTGRIRQLSWKRAGLLLLSGLALILPWAAARYARDGLTFFEGMVGVDVVGRLGSGATAGAARTFPLWYYLQSVFATPAMWIGLGLCVLGGLWLLLHRSEADPAKARLAIGCLLWLMVPVLLYSLSGSRYKWYVYSGFLALPALAAVTVSMVKLPAGRRWAGAVIGGAAALALCVLSVQNVAYVNGIVFDHSWQTFLKENLDREYDSGLHAYVQYSESTDGTGEVRRQWMQSDMLTALYTGDVICLDGGAEAFMEDEEAAVLFIARENNEEEIEELGWNYPQRNEGIYLCVFEN